SQHHNESRPEPVLLLSLVEHDLKGAHPDDEKTYADIVDFYSRARDPPHPRRIFDETENKKQCQNAHRQIDEENQEPCVLIRNPAPERGSNGRRSDRRDAMERECQPALPWRKSVRQNGLSHRLQATAAGPL